jgi:hypothetical protein
MATQTETSVVTDEQARARVMELGIQSEFEQMLEQAKRLVPHLRQIRVTLEYDPEGVEEPGLVIWCHRDKTGWENDRSENEWATWKLETFRPEVSIHFVMLTVYEEAHEW